MPRRSSRKTTKKDRAYALFCEGKVPTSSEIRALDVNDSTRYKYFYAWQADGKPDRVPEGPRHKASPAPSLPGGESVKVIDETRTLAEAEKAKAEEEKAKRKDKKANLEERLGAVSEEAEQKEDGEGKEDTEEKEDSEAKSGGPKFPSSSSGAKSIIGQGLTVTCKVSIKTMALYEYAATVGGDELTFGDFVDTCVEDFFRGRNQDLGIIKLS